MKEIKDIYDKYAELPGGRIKVIPGQTSSGKTYSIALRQAQKLAQHIISNYTGSKDTFVPYPEKDQSCFYCTNRRQLLEQFRKEIIDITEDILRQSGYRHLEGIAKRHIVWLKGQESIWSDNSLLKSIFPRIKCNNPELGATKAYYLINEVIVKRNDKALPSGLSKDDVKEIFRKQIALQFRSEFTKFTEDNPHMKKKRGRHKEGAAAFKPEIIFMEQSERWNWIPELYPASLVGNRHIFLLTTKKLFYPLSPIIDSPESILFSEFITGAEIYLDESNSDSEEMLNHITEEAAKGLIDVPLMFRNIVERLSATSFNKLWSELEIDEIFEKAHRGMPKMEMQRILLKKKKELKADFNDKVKPALSKVYESYNCDKKFYISTEELEKKRKFLFEDGNSGIINYRMNERVRTEAKRNVITEDRDTELPCLDNIINHMDSVLTFWYNFIRKVAAFIQESKIINEPDHNPDFIISNIFTTVLITSMGIGGETAVLDMYRDPYMKAYGQYILRSQLENGISNMKKEKYSNGINRMSPIVQNKGVHLLSMMKQRPTSSTVNIYKFIMDVTPEMYLQYMMSKECKIFLISATAECDSQKTNFDLEYLNSVSEESIYLEDEEIELLVRLHERNMQGEEKIEREVTGSISREDYCKNKVEYWVQLMGREAITKMNVPKTGVDRVYFAAQEISPLKIGTREEMPARVRCLMNAYFAPQDKEPTDRNQDFSEYRHFVLLSDMVHYFSDGGEKYNCGIAFCNGLAREMSTGGSSPVINLSFLIQAIHAMGLIPPTPEEMFASLKDAAEAIFALSASENTGDSFRDKVISRTKERKPIYIITTYNTSSVGQNMIIEVPDDGNYVKVGQKGVKVPEEGFIQTDINHIYLEKLTNVIPRKDNLIPAKTPLLDMATPLMYITYLLTKMKEHGEIDEVTFRDLLKAYMGSINPNRSAELFGELQKTPTYLSTCGHVYQQTLGRTTRTGCRSPYKRISVMNELTFSIDWLTKGFMTDDLRLLEGITSSSRPAPTDIRSNRNNNNFYSAVSAHNSLLSGIRKGNATRIAEYKEYRDTILRYASIEEAEYAKSAYFQFCFVDCGEESSRYYYSYKENPNGTFEDVRISSSPFSGSLCFDLDSINEMLDTFRRIPAARERLTELGVPAAFSPSRYLLQPLIYISIFRGGLGEVVGDAILNTAGIGTEDLPDDIFESFDRVVTGTNVMIDYKFWTSDHGVMSADQEPKIIGKAAKAQTSKVILVNIEYRGDYKTTMNILEGGRLKLLTIPALLTEDNKVDNKAIDIIRQFISQTDEKN